LLNTGKADYKPREKGLFNEDFGERKHIIGKGSNPIYICKKKEVPKLFDSEFWRMYEMWQFFHHGLPADGVPWSKVDPDILKIMIAFETYYKNEFSVEAGIYKAMLAYMGVK
jgi:hypothetical protein